MKDLNYIRDYLRFQTESAYLKRNAAADGIAQSPMLLSSDLEAAIRANATIRICARIRAIVTYADEKSFDETTTKQLIKDEILNVLIRTRYIPTNSVQQNELELAERQQWSTAASDLNVYEAGI